MASLIKQITEALILPLPGPPAQQAMAPPFRSLKKPDSSNVRQAAVMILLYLKHDEWHICYIKRVSHTGHQRHRGQISFPGGTRDAEDLSFEHTALREVHEEIGTHPSKIEILGGLTPLYIPVSNFNVHPFIGWLKEKPEFDPQLDEVAEIIEVPLSLLQSKKTLKIMDMPVGNQLTIKNTQYFDLNGEVLWGATAMITSEFLHLLN